MQNNQQATIPTELWENGDMGAEFDGSGMTVGGQAIQPCQRVWYNLDGSTMPDNSRLSINT